MLVNKEWYYKSSVSTALLPFAEDGSLDRNKMMPLETRGVLT
jgi:hypothetical protein